MVSTLAALWSLQCRLVMILLPQLSRQNMTEGKNRFSLYHNVMTTIALTNFVHYSCPILTLSECSLSISTSLVSWSSVWRCMVNMATSPSSLQSTSSFVNSWLNSLIRGRWPGVCWHLLLPLLPMPWQQQPDSYHFITIVHSHNYAIHGKLILILLASKPFFCIH